MPNKIYVSGSINPLNISDSCRRYAVLPYQRDFVEMLADSDIKRVVIKPIRVGKTVFMKMLEEAYVDAIRNSRT